MGNKQKNTLTTPEWITMNALWGKEPQVLSEIIESIGDQVEWSYNTYFSYMKILCEKGYVGYTVRGRMKFYYAKVEREECIEQESESIFHKLGSADAEKLLLCMLKKTKLSREGQEQLKDLIDQLAEAESMD